MTSSSALTWTRGRNGRPAVGGLESQRFDVDLPEGRVPATFLVAEAEGEIVGRVSIRHALTAYLADLVGVCDWFGSNKSGRSRVYAQVGTAHSPVTLADEQ